MDSKALSLGVKRPRRAADHSPPSSAEVKNAWSYTPNPPLRLHGVVLSYSTEQLYLYLLWNPNVQRRVHEHPQCDPIISQFSQTYNFILILLIVPLPL
jgi:hypothetical protein